MPLSPGTRIGQFEILSFLGAGGMGEVHRARDLTLGREVALKFVAGVVAPERRARFEHEARCLAALSHPGIAAIYGLLEDAGRPVIVMELAEGETLEKRLRRGPLPLRLALDVCRQIAEALAAAHEKGVVHRDLKPSNVTLAPDGRVKLLDFGLAKALEAEGAPSNAPTLT
ncbi:MAG: serine/threonine-protein kinase, partial [Candidatus Polarisedimenticolia bacterium]